MWLRTYTVESFNCSSMIQTLAQTRLKSHDKKLFVTRRLAYGRNHFESIGKQLRGKKRRTRGLLWLQETCKARLLRGIRVDEPGRRWQWL